MHRWRRANRGRSHGEGVGGMEVAVVVVVDSVGAVEIIGVYGREDGMLIV